MLYDAIEILLPDLCSALECTSTEVKPDSLGFLWCEDCSERRYLMEWGKRYGWPALSFGEYALAEGIEMYGTTALLGDDDRICAMLAAMEEWERTNLEEVA